MVDELSKAGKPLVVPALGTKISEFFGLDFDSCSDKVLADARGVPFYPLGGSDNVRILFDCSQPFGDDFLAVP
jgi:hypothetical protein